MVQTQAQGLGMAVVQAGALAQEQELAVFQTLDLVPKPAVAQVQEPAGFQAQAQAQALQLAGVQVQGLAQAQTLQARTGLDSVVGLGSAAGDGCGLEFGRWRVWLALSWRAWLRLRLLARVLELEQ